MELKNRAYVGASIGGIIGGAIPSILGDSPFSIMSVVLSAVGGFVGIYIAYKLAN